MKNSSPEKLTKEEMIGKVGAATRPRDTALTALQCEAGQHLGDIQELQVSHIRPASDGCGYEIEFPGGKAPAIGFWSEPRQENGVV